MKSAPKLSPTDAIELARRLVERHGREYCGEASLRLSYMLPRAPRRVSTLIRFDYV